MLRTTCAKAVILSRKVSVDAVPEARYRLLVRVDAAAEVEVRTGVEAEVDFSPKMPNWNTGTATVCSSRRSRTSELPVVDLAVTVMM